MWLWYLQTAAQLQHDKIFMATIFSSSVRSCAGQNPPSHSGLELASALTQPNWFSASASSAPFPLPPRAAAFPTPLPIFLPPVSLTTTLAAAADDDTSGDDALDDACDPAVAPARLAAFDLALISPPYTAELV
jgi:hypothetical protein